MHLKVLKNNRLKRKNNDMKKTTLLLMLLMTMLSLQNAKADKLEAYNVTSNVTANWSGNVSNTVDGNRDTYWWTAAAQSVGDYVTIEFEDPCSIGDIMLFFTGSDTPDGAVIEVSENNADWNEIARFGTSDIVSNKYSCNANGAVAKYVRMKITTATGKWLQFAEFEVYEHLSAERTISVVAQEGGTVTADGKSGSSVSNQIVTIEATPNTGYMFHYWKVGDDIVSYDYIYQDQSSSNKTYTAVFKEIPALANKKYYFKSKLTNGYLTVKKYNSSEEQSCQTAAKSDGNNDQIFTLEPAVEYNKFYIKSLSGYYLNCASWNVYAQNGDKTTPILFNEVVTGEYTLYQTTSTHKHGYLNVQTNHNNGLYCDEVSNSEDKTRWFLEEVEEVDKSELQALIAEAETLLAKVADYSKVEGDKITISGKITSNAAQNNADGNSGGSNDGKGISGLTDDDVTTYFHSRWGGQAIDEDHYLQIDLGEGNTLSDFCFSYSVRKGENTTLTSPAPTAIEVRVSENESDFGDPVAMFPKEGNVLPSYTDLGATLWHSGVISAGKDIRYIRLTVTESAGPKDIEWEGHYFFAMSALNLYKTKQVTAVKDAYKDVITAEQINMVAEALANANTVNNNNVASSAQVNTAASELDAVLEPLRTATKRYTLSVSAAGWASLYLDFPAAIPDFGNEDEEAGVYIVTGVKEGNWLILEKVIEGVLPANTGVIVKAAQGTYDFIYSEDKLADVGGNLLQGTVTDELIAEEAYVLSKPDGKEIGFYLAALNKDENGNNGTTHFKNNAYKSYLLSNDIFGGNKSAGYRFAFGGTTAVEEVEMRNEKGEIYDLTGRKLSEITKPGIYIVNGKKVLIK